MNERVLSTLWERIRLYVSSFMEEWEELSVASDMQVGLVRPDGQSITVEQDGTIHAVAALSVDETDPTVPEWAKQAQKPTYTAGEVGALPDTTTVPTKTSQLTNDSGFVTSVPTKTSELTNDSGFVTSVPTKVSELTNDSGFVTDIPVATTSVAGKVRPDGTTITIDADGTVHGSAQVDLATDSSAGIVRPDGTSVTIDQDGTIHAASEMSGPHWEVRDVDGTQRLVIVIPEEG